MRQDHIGGSTVVREKESNLISSINRSRTGEGKREREKRHHYYRLIVVVT